MSTHVSPPIWTPLDDEPDAVCPRCKEDAFASTIDFYGGVCDECHVKICPCCKSELVREPGFMDCMRKCRNCNYLYVIVHGKLSAPIEAEEQV